MGRKRVVIVEAIARFVDIRKSLFGKGVALVVAALLALSFLNLAALPGAAFADELAAVAGVEADAADVDADGDAAADAAEGTPLVLPAPEEPETGVNVFVYLQLKGEAFKTAQAAGLGLNADGWFTVGVIALDGIENPSEAGWGATVAVEEVQDQITEALKTIDFYPGAEALSLSAATWTSLRVNNGATDYDMADSAWHLDGELSEQLVNFDVHYVDAEGNALKVGDANDEGEKTGTRTILAALGSTVDAADQAIAIEGYEYSEALTEQENGGLSVEVKADDAARSVASAMTLVYEKKPAPVQPDNPGDNGDDPADNPVVPGDDGSNGGANNGGANNGNANPGSSNATVDVPNINFTMPSAPQGGNQGNAAAGRGFAANERTAVSGDTEQKLATTNAEASESTAAAATDLATATADEAPAIEEVVIDDATPMVARTGGAEAIAEEEVPLGAFDAPVDPAPWVAGLGAIGTALWGVVAVRRRLVMAQKLVFFEGQVLGSAPGEVDAVVVPNAGHQAL